MDTAETHALLQTYITQSALDLLSDIGAKFQHAESSEWLPDITAIIGIAGETVAGSVALCSSAECLEGLAKLGNTNMPEDWLGELANQLVGRFKRRIAPHGVNFALGTPTVVVGERLRVAIGRARQRSIVVRLEASIGRVEIWLEFGLAEGCELMAEPQEDKGLAEGEALLF
jgi:CheY-specific phosphatase CheX